MNRFFGNGKRILILLFSLSVLLSACGQPAAAPDGEQPRPADETPAASPEEPSTPSEPVEPIRFPAAGEMLRGECEAFSLPEDDGSRKVTIKYIDFRSEEASRAATYDLATTSVETGGPTLILWRENPLGGFIYRESNPVSEKADREQVLSMLSNADFESTEEEPWAWSMVLYVEDDGGKTEYRMDADGNLYRKTPDGVLSVARQAVDYFYFSALAYKYADDVKETGVSYPDHWLAEVTLWNYEEVPEEYAQWWDSNYPLPPAAHYRLCLQGEDFHVDLDREQALVMLRALFGVSWTGGASSPFIHEFSAREWNGAAGGIRLTEYLIPAGTNCEDYLSENEDVLRRSVCLYPDGTLVLIPRNTPGFHHYEYGIEQRTTSWQRFAVLEKAFDPAVLNACLSGLGVVKSK